MVESLQNSNELVTECCTNDNQQDEQYNEKSEAVAESATADTLIT
jgi:hypothetical protein